MDESKKVGYAAGFGLAVIALFSIPVGPPFVVIVAGFFPIILTFMVALGLFQLRRPIPNQVAYGVPLILSLLLGLLGALGQNTLFAQMETWYLAIANILGGLGVMAIMTDFMLPSPLTRTPSHVSHHIDEVLRYVYGVNEVIDRVYDHQTGADANLRKRLKLSASHAEQLERLFARKDYKKAHTIVYDLYEELRRLFLTEAEVVGHISLHARNRLPRGRSRIIDVLIDNDPQPVRRYVEALTHSLQNLNSELLGITTR